VTLTLAILAGVLLVIAALLTATEAATFRVSASRLRTLQEEGFRGADALVQLRSDPGRARAGVRMALSTLHVLVGSLATAAGLARGGVAGGALGAAAAGLAVLLLGDMLPRTLAVRKPVRLALLAAPPLLVFTLWFHRFATPVARLEGALAGEDDEEMSHEERELREIQVLGQEAGILEEEENLLVERAFRLDELVTWDVLTPRVDIFAWSDELTLEDIIDQLPGVPFSRVPVYHGSVDDITGILYVREAYQAYIEGRRDAPLSSMSRDPFFVPGSLSLARLLQDFQVRRIHMGIVADEFGGIDGLVTLEDVLEELVGEIVDETDIDEEELVRVSRNQLVADAGVDLREINYAFNVSLPLVEHRSLNGFILEEMGYVPAAGESLERSGVRIEVMEATDTQVLRARLTRIPGEQGTMGRVERG
jgi:CBS domain containing-hemolysin-like protein